MRLLIIRVLLAIVSLAVVSIGILAMFDTVPPKVEKVESVFQAEEKRAKCDMSDFEGFPKTIEGPVTLELKKLITVMVQNKDQSVSAEITLPKSRCEVL